MSVVAPATGPSGRAVWHTVHPLRSRSSSACLVFQNCNSDYRTHRAGASQLATRKVGLLTIDRIRDSPTPTRAETSRGPLINALNSRTRVFARSTRRHRTASSTNRAYSRSAIGASNCHPRPPSASHIWNHVFEVPGCAAHVLRNDTPQRVDDRLGGSKLHSGGSCGARHIHQHTGKLVAHT